MAEEAKESDATAAECDKSEQAVQVLEGVQESKSASDEEEEEDGVKDKQSPNSNWSAPILSLARKASETLSSGVSYGTALRNATSVSVGLPTKHSPEDDDGTAGKLPGRGARRMYVQESSAKDSMAVERSNLLSMMKLSVKVLIQASLALGRSLDSDYPPLQQFFVVLEHCLKHGLRGKKSFIGQSKSIWGPLELVEKLCPESSDIAISARDLPGIKTGLGRGRAWLHLALMQKKVADYLKALLDRRDLLR
ncbi:hypothetical protein COCON_G00040190 [Conger conger]|uniref:RUN domain-containing protein n=1 Tax=Conger conger TaxID=82655 RepID=A0A9Q1DTE5_CONCO|nr:hypothetical protein COCON_G00040190 [Conger conger]